MNRFSRLISQDVSQGRLSSYKERSVASTTLQQDSIISALLLSQELISTGWVDLGAENPPWFYAMPESRTQNL